MTRGRLEAGFVGKVVAQDQSEQAKQAMSLRRSTHSGWTGWRTIMPRTMSENCWYAIWYAVAREGVARVPD